MLSLFEITLRNILRPLFLDYLSNRSDNQFVPNQVEVLASVECNNVVNSKPELKQHARRSLTMFKKWLQFQVKMRCIQCSKSLEFFVPVVHIVCDILFVIGRDSWQKKCRSVTKYKYTYETKVITGTAILQDKKCFPDVKQTCVQLRVPTYRVISKFDLSYKYISLY